MPRIELIPDDTGDVTPTIDVCKEHAGHFAEGDPWEIEEDSYTIGSTDVDHPPYEDDEYLCAVCGEQLTNDD